MFQPLMDGLLVVHAFLNHKFSRWLGAGLAVMFTGRVTPLLRIVHSFWDLIGLTFVFLYPKLVGFSLT